MSKKIHTTGEVFPDKTVIELVYDQGKDKTMFAISEKGKTFTQDKYVRGDTEYIPYSQSNNLIKNRIVLLPSGISKYDNYQNLVDQVQKYIHRYVDLDPNFERVCTYYVIMSWIHDQFNQVPYIRKCGEFGSGKTRFLSVIGSVCYKPVFASGSSSVAAIFHTLDSFRGASLILDEADFRFSDKTASITKILNNGFSKGYPVLRCFFNKNKEFDPIGYQVFGCKVVASQKRFSDKALESRFITEHKLSKDLRSDVPIELPDSFQKETMELRNMLLCFRLDIHGGKKQFNKSFLSESIEPRLRQIFSPIYSLVENIKVKREIEYLAYNYSKRIKKTKSSTIENHVLKAIEQLKISQQRVSIGDITEYIKQRYGKQYDREINPKWIGHVVSKSLALPSYKVGGRFYVDN